ncbi:MAG: DUF3592 domain-containing protein [Fimbriimonadales bacterium]
MMRTLFTALGWLFLVGGIISIAGGFLLGGPAMLGLVLMGVAFIPIGIAFIVVSKYLKGLDPSEILRSGTPQGMEADASIAGTALVTSTRDTGVILNNVNLVVEVGLSVEVPGRAPYDAKARHVLQGRNQWGALQPGMTVPVLINPNDPSKVVIDGSRPIVSAGGLSGIGRPTKVESAADLIAAGTKTTATLEIVAPTGMTAGQAKAGLPANEADDLIMQVAFTYEVLGNAQRVEILVRVPDGKDHVLHVGGAVPISYMPENPANATIDWESVPVMQV